MVWTIPSPFSFGGSGAARLVSTPSRKCFRAWLGIAISGFPDFGQFYSASFPTGTQACLSPLCLPISPHPRENSRHPHHKARSEDRGVPRQSDGLYSDGTCLGDCLLPLTCRQNTHSRSTGRDLCHGVVKAPPGTMHLFVSQLRNCLQTSREIFSLRVLEETCVLALAGLSRFDPFVT